jgi:hypothetical protein
MSFEGSWVTLPRDAHEPFQVFVNGVLQEKGVDYVVRGDELLFARELKPERLGFWRWTLMFFSIAGSYGAETVDVRFERGGRPTVATGLEIRSPKGE